MSYANARFHEKTLSIDQSEQDLNVETSETNRMMRVGFQHNNDLQ